MLYNVRMNITCADPGIFVRGGGVQVNLTKKADVFFFFFFFFCPQLIMVNFKENYHFSRFQGGGSNCLFPIETHMTCDFPGGSGPPVPPSGSALV